MITIVLPVSRTEYLRPVFNCLNALERPESTELLIITDGDASLEQAVNRRLESISYKRIQVISYGDTPGEDIDSRRFRISDLHNKAKNFINPKSKYVFSIEDDTTYPSDTLIRLYDVMARHEDCAFVEGVELGRRNTPYVGAWKADNIKKPNNILSVEPPYVGDPLKNEINLIAHEIDAGGLYCALIDAEQYRSHHFQPFDADINVGLSCDLNFGLWLRNKGFKCFIDWSVQCDHIGDKGSVNLGNTKPKQVRFDKRGGEWGVWRV